MSPGDLVTLFGGSTAGGTALVFCILFISNVIYTRGQYNLMRDQRDEARKDRDDWKRIAELERARSEAGVLAAKVLKDVVVGIRRGTEVHAIAESLEEGE